MLGFITLGLLGNPLLNFICSNADFPNPILWNLLGFAFFVERYGAMHLQMYSLSNKIIWHKIHLGFGLIYIITCLLMFDLIGFFAFPLGIIAGHLGFYTWYATKHSYKLYDLKFWSFEKTTFIYPFIAIVIYIIVVHT